jgi:hypothetical protein
MNNVQSAIGFALFNNAGDVDLRSTYGSQEVSRDSLL